jgi:hypothetical protein
MANRVADIRSFAPPPVPIPQGFGQPIQAPPSMTFEEFMRGQQAQPLEVAQSQVPIVEGRGIPSGPVDVQFDQAIAPSNFAIPGQAAAPQIPGQPQDVQPPIQIVDQVTPFPIPPGMLVGDVDQFVTQVLGPMEDPPFLSDGGATEQRNKERRALSQALHLQNLKTQQEFASLPTAADVGLPLEHAGIPFKEEVRQNRQISPFQAQLLQAQLKAEAGETRAQREQRIAAAQKSEATTKRTQQLIDQDAQLQRITDGISRKLTSNPTMKLKDAFSNKADEALFFKAYGDPDLSQQRIQNLEDRLELSKVENNIKGMFNNAALAGKVLNNRKALNITRDEDIQRLTDVFLAPLKFGIGNASPEESGAWIQGIREFFGEDFKKLIPKGKKQSSTNTVNDPLGQAIKEDEEP